MPGGACASPDTPSGQRLLLDHARVDRGLPVAVRLAVVVLILLGIEEAAALEPLAVLRQRPIATQLAAVVDAPRSDHSGPKPVRCLQIPGKVAVRLVVVLRFRSGRRLAGDLRTTERV